MKSETNANLKQNKAKYNKSNVVLIGFMGSGKSITGKLLAYRMGYSFVDTDVEIEKTYKMKIKDMFAKEGEAVFRQRETETIKRLSQKSHQVISTGGGVATKQEDMDALRQNGVIISLSAYPSTILKRTGNDKRPLLAKKSNEERLKAIVELMAKRAKFYKNADLIVQTDDKTPLQNVETITKYLKGLK